MVEKKQGNTNSGKEKQGKSYREVYNICDFLIKFSAYITILTYVLDAGIYFFLGI